MKLFATLLTLLFTVSGRCASVDPYDVVVTEDRTTATVILRTTVAVPNDAEIQLFDGQNFVVYYHALSSGEYLNKRILRADFLSGHYTLVFTDRGGRTEIPFQLHRNKAMSFDINDCRHFAYPAVDLRRERMLVVRYPNESGKRVNVRLTNEEGQQVFADKLQGEGIRRSYRLSELKAGKYTVTVTSTSLEDYTTAIALQ